MNNCKIFYQRSISLLILFFVVLCSANIFGQSTTSETPAQKEQRMKWWNEARFGMFIHWGLYSVPAGVWEGKDIPFLGEWIMNSAKIPVAEYAKFAGQFNPTKYNAEQWVKLAKEAGMKYIVITTKHHDGFAMFKSDASKFNIVDATPFKRDVIKELATACKKYGMKLGFYYSQSQDWHHAGGAADRGHWDKAQEGSMDEYIDKVAVPQMKEILTKYGPVSVLWFDTPAAMNKDRAEKFLPILKLQPGIIYNNRLGGGISGDLETPEQFIPATGYPGKNWESCMTMNETWGFKKNDQNWKSPEMLIRNLIDIASKGGNYLLNVGPTSEGLIPDSSVVRLKKYGEWLKINGEAIYGTKASPFPYLKWGRCTRTENKLYLSVFDWPQNGILHVPAAITVKKAYLLVQPSKLLKTRLSDGRLEISLPATAPDKVASVVVIETDGEIAVQPAASDGKMFTASSSKKESTADKAFDNDGNTRWEASDEDRNVSLEVDLGKPVDICAAFIQESEGWDRTIQTFQFEYKDGDQWKIIFDGKRLGMGSVKTFPTVKAQQFRLKILSAQKAPYISEMKLYQDQ
ncbi:alpha-L-fucosidase [Paludibacter jiangxiensis]|uniref:alpha-L-fucosidase n=1 Tax=Paludibacter jiangxiensis TaxID=681398 RepID=A0A161LWN9_9BACT|nr:alpha-L-fucosidase [Paludibacter jiangxiensis]GAT63632.1 alpha-L-fucosidase [Paludibacter jiangxiensis]